MLLKSIAFFCCLPLLAQTTSLGPLRFGEKNPFYRMYATPRAESADLIASGTWVWETGLAHSNVFERSSNNRFQQDFDLEITTLNLGIKRRIGAWEVGAEVNIDSYDGGFLDHAIQEFHSIFGLANDDRDTVPNNRFAFLLIDREQAAILQRSDEDQQFGDVILHAKRSIRQAADRSLSVWGQLRVPTGEEGVNSSGEISGNLGFAYRRSYSKWSMHANISGVWLNPDAPQDAIVKQAAVLGMFAVERKLWRNLSLLAQLDGGSAYVGGTGLSNLDDPPLNFILGIQTLLAKKWHWQLGFSEDLLADGPSVDFAIETSLRKVF